MVKKGDRKKGNVTEGKWKGRREGKGIKVMKRE